MFNYGYSDARWNAGTGCVDGSSTLKITPPTHYLDLNGWLDGASSGSISGYGTADVYINGSLASNDVTDYYTALAVGTTYEIKDIKATTGHQYNGVHSGSLSGTIGNSDVSVYLDFSTKKYTISYAANGGSSTPSSQTKTHGTNITIASAISRSNSTATGYSVTFNANGGTYTGTTPIKATDTTRYTFSSWKSSATGTTWSAGATNFSENNTTTLTAQWSSSTTKGSITLPAASTVSRSYYTFAGWNTKADGTGTNYSAGASYTPSANTTLYAKWTLNAPTAATVSLDYVCRDKIYVKSIGYTGAGLSGYTLYYRVNNTGSYSSINLGTATTGTISNLQPNTTYQIYVKATNAAGSKDSSVITATTIADLPKNLSISLPTLLPFSGTVSVSATGDTNAPITNYKYYYTSKPNINLYDMPIKSFGGARWARIFYHNNRNGSVLFTSLAECKNTQTVDKYSRLGLLDSGDTYKINGKYEFLLEYPIDAPGQYNRWKQTNAPQNEFVTETSAGTGTATGYEAVHID